MELEALKAIYEDDFSSSTTDLTTVCSVKLEDDRTLVTFSLPGEILIRGGKGIQARSLLPSLSCPQTLGFQSAHCNSYIDCIPSQLFSVPP